MSDQAAIVAIVACFCLGLTMCSVSNNWRFVEAQKIQLERDKLGVAK